MLGKLIFVHRYSRKMLQESSNELFVFGDNCIHEGLGGQAAACRGEPNAVGIPTKIFPDMEPGSFLKDEHLFLLKPTYDRIFDMLVNKLKAGVDIVWPNDGIGTGLAKLPESAPKIHEYLQKKLNDLNLVAQGIEPDRKLWDHGNPEPINIVCKTCGSKDVRRDAWAEWDTAQQKWILGEVFDDGFCMACETSSTLEEVKPTL